MNNNHTGVSNRSLVLLGAFAALALNKNLRRDVVRGTRGAVSSAQETFESTVLPALGTVTEQAGHRLEQLREEAPHLIETAQERAKRLTELAAARAYALRDEAEDTLQDARKEYAPKVRQARRELMDSAEERRKQAEKALGQARRVGAGLLSETGKRASNFMDEASDTFDRERHQIERGLLRARRDAERELRRTQKHWNAERLQKEVDRRMVPLRKQASRQLMLLEKEAAKHGRDLNLRGKLPKGWMPEPQRRGGLSGGTTALIVLGVGAVVVARVPQVRHAIMDAVESVNPDVAKKLRETGRSVRDIVGEAWIEDIKDAPAAPAPAPKASDAGTTGSTAGAAVAPDSAAEKGQVAKPTEAKPGETGQVTTHVVGAQAGNVQMNGQPLDNKDAALKPGGDKAQDGKAQGSITDKK